MLLAFDTSGLTCSVALREGGKLWTAVSGGDPQHSRQLLPTIEALLNQAQRPMQQVTALAYGRGPGSFTGIRVAAGVAQGLGFSLNVPVLPISTLEALAYQAWRRHHATRVFAALDARLGELYTGGYAIAADGGLTILSEERVGQAAVLPSIAGSDWFGIGSGWYLDEAGLRAALQSPVRDVDAKAIPLAEDIAALALQVLVTSSDRWPAEAAQPVYLRDRVAHGS